MKKLVSFLLALMLLLSLTACASSGASDVPPKFDALLSKYGAPKEEAVKALGISEADLKQSERPGYTSWFYKDTGIDVSFCGTNFDLLLLDNYDRLDSFLYYASLTDKKEAAKVVASISEKAKKLYGRAIDLYGGKDDYRMAEKTAAELEELFQSAAVGTEIDYYTINLMTSEDARELLSELEEKDNSKLWGDDIMLVLGVNVIYGDAGARIVLHYMPLPPDQIVRS